ncbi:hypothetical protein C491_19877 [Natronococcus amylolyticus DSM 10524]|uniref:DUF8152 domain-containing protein n=1 Tax=Natronococcus amylolyticus DSM 10524 TaxID=1227497 RepID=L9WX88_9EURY|nr:hypothetical protein [Natronococcus amylolyticus]ELY54089.1 hypothetical protein C491_19877 [Natronococcus amylolyticus DSM 10524]
MTDSEDSLEDQLAALRDHLEATAELPIDPQTNRWLGEAEAVARDAAAADVDPETARKRIQQVQRLLSAADDPDHEDAVAHCEAARELCDRILQ